MYDVISGIDVEFTSSQYARVESSDLSEVICVAVVRGSLERSVSLVVQASNSSSDGLFPGKTTL